jgi:hypothetical protein
MDYPRPFICALVASLLGSGMMPTGDVLASPQVQASNPSVVAPLAWTRTIKMPDGRTFVSDGGMMIDAAIARPASLPTVVIPPESSQAIARNFTAPFDKEIALSDLRAASLKNSFATPDGIGVNGNYVNYLRSVLSDGRTRLRTKGPRDPIVVMMAGQAIAVVMPMVLPRALTAGSRAGQPLSQTGAAPELMPCLGCRCPLVQSVAAITPASLAAWA